MNKTIDKRLKPILESLAEEGFKTKKYYIVNYSDKYSTITLYNNILADITCILYIPKYIEDNYIIEIISNPNPQDYSEIYTFKQIAEFITFQEKRRNNICLAISKIDPILKKYNIDLLNS